MNMDFGLNLTQEQKLVMTQQMQLSVKLLQMSTYELQEFVEKELVENPVLDINEAEIQKQSKEEIDPKELLRYLESDNYGYEKYERNRPDDDEISPFMFISEKKSLICFLREQILELNVSDFLKDACMYIVENIDERGYLDASLEDMTKNLKIDSTMVQEALEIVQNLEPDGIGARDLRECLKIQLKKKGIFNEEIEAIIDNHLELVAENKFNAISKILDIDVKKAQEYGDFIKKLEPKPSRGFYTGDEVRYVTPDAYIRKIDEEYHVIMNDDIAPKLCINETYRHIVNNDNDKEALEYVKNKMNNAMFVIKSIEQRKSTIYRVLSKIVEIQKEYFENGESCLKPMTMKEIAESLNMHESTISRAIRDKYVYTNRGTVKIKELFTTGIVSSNHGEDVSTAIIKKAIKDMVDGEDKTKPLSDQAICEILNKKGMNISRRTVAKYREELEIKSSKGRKRF